MKTRTIQFGPPVKKSFMLGLFLLCGFLLSSYKSSACTASFTYTVGVNGHYSFTSTSVGVGNGTQYSWNPGDGSGWHYGSTTFAYTYTANATCNAQLAIYDSNRCIDTVTVPITISNVYTPCLLSASFNYSVGAHGVVTFTSTSSGTYGGTQYFWAPGDSNLRVQWSSTYTHTYLYQGYYGVWLTIEDTGFSYCIDSVYEYIYVGTADSSHCHIHANFTYTTGANGEVTFTNTSTGTQPGYYYSWIMGDTAGYSNGSGPINYTYAFNGTHYVTLYVTSNDSDRCMDSITLPVTVTNACNLEANFSVVYDTGANAGKAQFKSTSIGVNGGTTYTWNFGDGSPTVTGSADSASHQYSFIGFYTVTLTDSNSNGCVSTYTDRIYIYNKDSLQACFSYWIDSSNIHQYDFDAGCSLGTNGNTYYKWTPGDGDPSDSGLGMTTYTHTYLINGPYSATLTIWYTILPHSVGSAPRYDESSYTAVINVTNATGVANIKDAGNYTIYPNPSDGSFKIAMNGMGSGKNALIKVSNMMGQVVYQTNQTLSGGNTLSEISLPNAANGIYLLQITTDDNTYTSRIAIQK